MATAEAFTNHDHDTGREVGLGTATQESLANRGIPFAGIGGAVGGAIAGVALGAEFNTAYPMLFGTLGTMLGSALVAVGWCALASLFAADEANHDEREQATARPERAIPASSAERGR